MASHRDDLVQRVARRIAEVRVEHGLTQDALAAQLDIATKNMQRIESGGQNLTLRTVERIANVLCVEPEEFFRSGAAAGSLPAPLSILAAAGFRVRVPTQSGRRPRTAVPVIDVRAAAGLISGAPRVSDMLGWVELHRHAPSPAGQFAAQVRGASMEPLVPDGSVCLFGRLPPGRIEGRVALVEHRALADADLGGPYALKRLGRVKVLRGGRQRVTLESVNPQHEPIVLVLDDPDELRVIADFIEILAPARKDGTAR